MNQDRKRLLSFIAIFLFTLLVITATWLGLKFLDDLKITEIFVSFIVNLIGIFVGAGLAYWFALNQFEIQSKNLEKKALSDKVFELYDEFNSSGMLRIRSEAGKLTRQHPNTPAREMYKTEGGEKSLSIWVLARFYEKLWITIDNQKIDISYVPDFFGETFYWWYIVYFEENLLLYETQMCTRIAKLKAWFDLQVSDKTVERWTKRSTESKSKRQLTND